MNRNLSPLPLRAPPGWRSRPGPGQRWWILPLLVILLCAGSFIGAVSASDGERSRAEESQVPVGEHVRRLLLENHTEEAATLLEAHREHGEIPPVELEVLDGLVAQQRGDHEQAVWHLRQALALQPERVSVHLYLAQSLYALDRDTACHQELLAGEGVGERLPAYFVLRARVEQRLGRLHDAFRTTEQGLSLHPDAPLLVREQSLVLVGLGLLETAETTARRYLVSNPTDRAGWLLLAEALRVAGDVDEAIALLEEANQRFPGDVDVISRLAHAYAQAGAPNTSARMFMQAQVIQPRFAFEIAEQLRMAGHYRRALFFNGQVADAKRKLTQRLGIYMGMERHDLAIALLPDLQEHDWMDDMSRYQVAYACYATGRDQELQALAARIQDPWLSSAVKEMVDAMGPSTP